MGNRRDLGHRLTKPSQLEPGHIPQAHTVIGTGRNKGLAIGAEIKGLDASQVTFKDGETLLGPHVPEHDGRIAVLPARSGHHGAVRAETHSADRSGVSHQASALRAALDIPEPHHLIISAGGQD